MKNSNAIIDMENQESEHCIPDEINFLSMLIKTMLWMFRVK